MRMGECECECLDGVNGSMKTGVCRLEHEDKSSVFMTFNFKKESCQMIQFFYIVMDTWG